MTSHHITLHLRCVALRWLCRVGAFCRSRGSLSQQRGGRAEVSGQRRHFPLGHGGRLRGDLQQLAAVQGSQGRLSATPCTPSRAALLVPSPLHRPLMFSCLFLSVLALSFTFSCSAVVRYVHCACVVLEGCSASPLCCAVSKLTSGSCVGCALLCERTAFCSGVGVGVPMLRCGMRCVRRWALWLRASPVRCWSCTCPS